ncbi:MAG: hypothetical protein ACXVBJ_12220, partial [Flavisolibacter sp.]
CCQSSAIEDADWPRIICDVLRQNIKNTTESLLDKKAPIAVSKFNQYPQHRHPSRPPPQLAIGSTADPNAAS